MLIGQYLLMILWVIIFYYYLQKYIHDLTLKYIMYVERDMRNILRLHFYSNLIVWFYKIFGWFKMIWEPKYYSLNCYSNKSTSM
jgi:hypothetical protein